jgi:hypothetical protein
MADRLKWAVSRYGLLKFDGPHDLHWHSYCDICSEEIRSRSVYHYIGRVGFYRIYWYVCEECKSKIDQMILDRAVRMDLKEQRYVAREVKKEIKRSILEYKKHMNDFRERLSYLKREEV